MTVGHHLDIGCYSKEGLIDGDAPPEAVGMNNESNRDYGMVGVPVGGLDLGQEVKKDDTIEEESKGETSALEYQQHSSHKEDWKKEGVETLKEVEESTVSIALPVVIMKDGIHEDDRSTVVKDETEVMKEVAIEDDHGDENEADLEKAPMVGSTIDKGDRVIMGTSDNGLHKKEAVHALEVGNAKHDKAVGSCTSVCTGEGWSVDGSKKRWRPTLGNRDKQNSFYSCLTDDIGGEESTVTADDSMEQMEQGHLPSPEELAKSHKNKDYDNTLSWRNISMSLKKKGGRLLLNDTWGEVHPRRLTAVMGPSGAGKTTLLNVLAGRIRSNAKLSVRVGELRLGLHTQITNPSRNMDYRRRIAFVAQDDTLVPTATPRECLRFSARLRLPRDVSDDEVERTVEDMLDELGLSRCADVFVGGPLVKGLSGGERKRTSVGVELVVRPSIVFLDEPTSGLDSYSALQVVNALRRVARSGAGVLCTIHQPSSSVYAAFDAVIFLVAGRVLYGGPAGPSSAEVFAAMGGGRPAYTCPAHHNPCDWIVHVSQSTPAHQLEADGYFQGPPPSAMAIAGVNAKGVVVNKGFSYGKRKVLREGAPWLLQIKILLVRETQSTRRNRMVTFAKLALGVLLAIMISFMFFGVARTETSDMFQFQSHFGALMMSLVLVMCGSSVPAMLTFPDERPVFLREYSTNHFSVFSYFTSALWVEALWTLLQTLIMTLTTYWTVGFRMDYKEYLAMCYGLAIASTAIAALLGSAIGDPKLAYQLLPVVFCPQLLLCGFFVNPNLMPTFLIWAPYLCPLTYALRLALLAEFGADSCDTLTCRVFLSQFGAIQEDSWWYWTCLVGLFLVYRLMALLVLQRKAIKFF